MDDGASYSESSSSLDESSYDSEDDPDLQDVLRPRDSTRDVRVVQVLLPTRQAADTKEQMDLDRAVAESMVETAYGDTDDLGATQSFSVCLFIVCTSTV